MCSVQAVAAVPERLCAGCGEPLGPGPVSKRVCSERCRKRVQRQRRASRQVDKVEASPAERPAGLPGPLERAAAATLERFERAETIEGAIAVTMARNVDAAPPGSSMVATLMREFRSTMAEALRGVQTTRDSLDDIRDRAAAKLDRLGR
jgi:predicted nucleic acid-binding Zn ribbon protein